MINCIIHWALAAFAVVCAILSVLGTAVLIDQCSWTAIYGMVNVVLCAWLCHRMTWHARDAYDRWYFRKLVELEVEVCYGRDRWDFIQDEK